MIDAEIKDLLEKNNTVIIPNLGALTLNANGSIFFNQYIKYDDSKIVNALSTREGIDKDAAKSQVSDYVENINTQLEKNEPFTVSGLGQFEKAKGKITFNTSTSPQSTKAPETAPERQPETVEKPKPTPKTTEVPEQARPESRRRVEGPSKKVIPPQSAKVVKAKDSPKPAPSASSKATPKPTKTSEKATPKTAPKKTTAKASLDEVLNPTPQNPAASKSGKASGSTSKTAKSTTKPAAENSPKKTTAKAPAKKPAAPKTEKKAATSQKEAAKVAPIPATPHAPEPTTAKATPPPTTTTPPQTTHVPEAPAPSPKEQPKTTPKPTKPVPVEPAPKTASKAPEKTVPTPDKTDEPVAVVVEKEEKKRRIPWLWIILLVLLIGMAVFTALKWEMVKGWFGSDGASDSAPMERVDSPEESISIDEEGLDDPETPEQATTSEPETAATDDEVETDAPEATSAVATDETEEASTDPAPRTNTPVQSAGNTSDRFHVVAGSFTYRNNAENLVASLQADGHPARIIGKRKDMWVAVYSSHATMEEAIGAMRQLRDAGKKGWVVIKTVR